MTPKEKAHELIDIYYNFGDQEFDYSKEFSLIAVDEIVKSKSLKYLFTEEQIYSMEATSDDRWIYDTFMEYWEEVKQEIEKL